MLSSEDGSVFRDEITGSNVEDRKIEMDVPPRTIALFRGETTALHDTTTTDATYVSASDDGLPTLEFSLKRITRTSSVLFGKELMSEIHPVNCQ